MRNHHISLLANSGTIDCPTRKRAPNNVTTCATITTTLAKMSKKTWACTAEAVRAVPRGVYASALKRIRCSLGAPLERDARLEMRSHCDGYEILHANP